VHSSRSSVHRGAANLLTKTGAGIGQRIFIGQEYDAACTLSYLNARYYDGPKGLSPAISMTHQDRELILITGVPGTGKTWYGNAFAKQFGFRHYDLENSKTRQRYFGAPAEFIAAILKRNEDAVVTWGFVPDAQQIEMVRQFEAGGFKLVWFDGNRPAAIRAFIRRGDVSEEALYAQMWKIENSRVIQKIAPLIINTFDENE
jgi:hypothetical protein